VRALNDANVETAAPIDVIVWTNEEGVRFSPPLAGSSVFAGAADVATIHAARTLDGTTVRQDLESSVTLVASRPDPACSIASSRRTSSRVRSSRQTPHDRHRHEDPGHPLVARRRHRMDGHAARHR
jgi:hypothetical protein